MTLTALIQGLDSEFMILDQLGSFYLCVFVTAKWLMSVGSLEKPDSVKATLRHLYAHSLYFC